MCGDAHRCGVTVVVWWLLICVGTPTAAGWCLQFGDCCGLAFAVWWLHQRKWCPRNGLAAALMWVLSAQWVGDYICTNRSVNNGLVIQWSGILCTVKSHIMGYFWTNRSVNNWLVIQWSSILCTVKSHMMGWCLQCECCPRIGLAAASVGAVRIMSWCLKVWMFSTHS